MKPCPYLRGAIACAYGIAAAGAAMLGLIATANAQTLLVNPDAVGVRVGSQVGAIAVVSEQHRGALLTTNLIDAGGFRLDAAAGAQWETVRTTTAAKIRQPNCDVRKSCPTVSQTVASSRRDRQDVAGLVASYERGRLGVHLIATNEGTRLFAGVRF